MKNNERYTEIRDVEQLVRFFELQRQNEKRILIGGIALGLCIALSVVIIVFLSNGGF